MPNENRLRRNVVAALGTMLLATAVIASMAIVAPSQATVGGVHPAISPHTAAANALVHPTVTPAAPRPDALIGPIHGKYFVGNTSLPSGASNFAQSVAVDTATQTVYSANFLATTVTAFSESTGQVEQAAVVGNVYTDLPIALAVDPKTNTLFVAEISTTTGWVLAMNASTLSVEANLSTLGSPHAAFQPSYGSAFDPSSNQVFFENSTDGLLMAINAATNHVTYIACPATPCSGREIIAVPQLGELVQTTGGPNVVIYNTSTDTPSATLTVPTVPTLLANTYAVAYDPSSEMIVVGNHSSSNTAVFFEFNLSTHAYVGTLPNDPSYVYQMVYDAAHNDLIAEGANVSRTLVAVNAATGVVDGQYQEASTGFVFYSLALDEPAGVVITSGVLNNSSFAFHLPSLTPAVAYSSFPYLQIGIAVNPATDTAFSLDYYQGAIRATSESTGAAVWIYYLHNIAPGTASNVAVVDPTTDTLYVVLHVGHVAVFNASTGALETRLTLSAGVNATTLAIDTTAHLLFVAQNDENVSVWSTTTHARLGTVMVKGLIACAAAVNPVLHLAYFANCATPGNVSSVNGITFTQGPTFGAGSNPVSLAIDAAGILYVSNEYSNNITRINTGTAVELSALTLGSYSPLQLAVDSADSLLALTSVSSASVELVDPGTGILLAAALVGTETYSIAYDPTSQTFLAPTYYGGSMFELQALASPSAPTGVTATAGNTTLKASWTPPSSAVPITGFTVSLGTSATGPWGQNQSVTTTNYTYSGLTDGTKYFVVITATTVAGTSPASASANGTPLGVPFPPTAVAAVTGNSTQINVSWAAPSSTQGSAVVNYTLKWTIAGGATWTSVSEGTALSAVLSGLHPSTNFTVEVVAWNSVGASHTSAPSTAATKAAPSHSSSSGSGGSNNLLYYVIAGVVIAALLAAVAIAMMRRKKPSGGVTPYSPGPSSAPPTGTAPPASPPPGAAQAWTEDSGASPPPGAR
ncbi:MAG: fibronectin type III domain-containing protein [Thermoplasmata archaeon]|nr:fibronectin type III domain-containing protein [Thermoplasmata archaeon]